MVKSAKPNISNDKVCLVIPFHNEVKNVSPLLEEWTTILHFHKIDYQILAVNAGSTDDTRGVLRNLASNNTNITVLDIQDRGHGKALTEGLKEATQTNCRWIFHTDSNGQIRALDFLKFWGNRNQFQTQIGYRGQRVDGIFRTLLSNSLSRLVTSLFNTKLRDINIPYRMYENSHLSLILEEIPSITNYPNVYLSLLSSKTSDGIRQIPVVHRRRQFGHSSKGNLTLALDYIRLVLELITFRSIFNFKVSEIRNLIKKSKSRKVISK
jgi:glycosyltransferase involved in cell wall biosynthesis